MYRWNTNNLLQKLSHLGSNVSSRGPDTGCHDTDCIIVEHNKNKRFYIVGWDPETDFEQGGNWSDVDVSAISINDGMWQDTPFDGHDPDVIQLYADILKVIKPELAGTQCGVITHWKDIF